MCWTITTLYTVCAHSIDQFQNLNGQPCGCTRPTCQHNQSLHVVHGFCDVCITIYDPLGTCRANSHSIVKNYWHFKESRGWDRPIDPQEIPISALLLGPLPVWSPIATKSKRHGFLSALKKPRAPPAGSPYPAHERALLEGMGSFANKQPGCAMCQSGHFMDMTEHARNICRSTLEWARSLCDSDAVIHTANVIADQELSLSLFSPRPSLPPVTRVCDPDLNRHPLPPAPIAFEVDLNRPLPPLPTERGLQQGEIVPRSSTSHDGQVELIWKTTDTPQLPNGEMDNDTIGNMLQILARDARQKGTQWRVSQDSYSSIQNHRHGRRKPALDINARCHQAHLYTYAMLEGRTEDAAQGQPHPESPSEDIGHSGTDYWDAISNSPANSLEETGESMDSPTLMSGGLGVPPQRQDILGAMAPAQSRYPLPEIMPVSPMRFSNANFHLPPADQTNSSAHARPPFDPEALLASSSASQQQLGLGDGTFGVFGSSPRDTFGVCGGAAAPPRPTLRIRWCDVHGETFQRGCEECVTGPIVREVPIPQLKPLEDYSKGLPWHF